MRPLAVLLLLAAGAHASGSVHDSAECLSFVIPRGYQRVVSKAGRAAVIQSTQSYRLGSGEIWPSLTVEISPSQGLPLISIDNQAHESLRRDGNDYAPEGNIVKRLTHSEFVVRKLEISGVPASRWDADGVVEMFGATSREHLILIRMVVGDRFYAVSAGWNLAREKIDRPAAEAFLASLRVLPACR